MADSILKLRVDSQEYDNKLKRASEGLQRYIDGCRKAGGTLEHLDDGVEAFTKDLGNMGTAATGAKGKLNEMTKSFTDLSVEYKHLTDQEKASPFGKALSASLDQLQGRIKQTKADLADINSKLDDTKGGGGLFGGDKMSGMLQVFGGNVMTKLAGAGIGFLGEMGDMVKQGIELSKAAEGVRIAFERLNQPGILANLREATHGTVTDLELMKAAVKFNDFKLPLEELGTMLAFAQQKAKDTGQSVDYMTESIVTGLGRKSLMILDNLGLSAAEVREKMKETGDMTKAVGEIIREQMSKAGDYVETAADRATQANVSLQNKMEELGRKFAPVKEASDQLWTSIKIGILDIVGGPLADLLNGLTRAGQLRNEIANAGGSERVTADINKLKGSNFKPQAFQMMLATYSREEQAALNKWKQSQKGGMGSIAIWENRYLAAKALREEFQNKGNAVVNPTPATNNNPLPVVVTNTPTGSGNAFDASKLAFTPGEGERWTPQEMPSVLATYGDDLRKLMGLGTKQADLGMAVKMVDPDAAKRKTATDDPYKFANDFSKIVGGVGNITAGLQTLGVDLPEGFTKTIAAIQTISGILTAILAITSAIEASSTVSATASTIDAIIPFARGGKIPRAASGYYVPGTRYSGDTTLIRANAGELILNQSSQNNLAADLQHAQALVGMIQQYQSSMITSAQVGNDAAVVSGGVAQSVNRQPYMTGEMIFLGLNTYLESSGRGELITSRNK